MSLLDQIIMPSKVVKEINFYTLQETHITYLTNHYETQQLVFEAQKAEKYKGDFYGLLDFLSIDKKYHYLIMRVNGYYCSSDYEGDRNYILLPSLSEMGKIFSIYNSIED